MILLLAVGLSMDAFAVSVTNGMCYKMPVLKNALYSALAFGVFQGLMPLLGYFAGQSFSGAIERYDHWLALGLLGFIGAHMIYEAITGMRDNGDSPERIFSFKVLILQAVATSVDALAIGISLGVMKANLALAVILIATVTFIFCFAAVIIGKRFGGVLKEKAEITGGVILILIGLRIFVEHMGLFDMFRYYFGT